MRGSLANVSICFITLVILAVNLGDTRGEEQNLTIYDSDFFSIKYPSSWHIRTERWVTGIPGDSLILDNNQNDTHQSNRITPHSNMGHSVIAVIVVPRSSIPISRELSASELVDSFVDRFFSQEKLSENGAQLLTDNHTSLSGIQARSVSFTDGGHYNLLIHSADDINLYQIGFVGQESKYQKELPEVQSIISSFQIKGTTDSGTQI